MAKRSPKQTPRFDWLPGLALVLAVFAAYLPTVRAGYLWDDDLLIFANQVILSPDGLQQIWTTNAADICPLTLTTFWFEHQIWGANPLPYHIINVLFHAASTVVLWRVLLRLKIPGAWIGAGLWALHPVQVDSVAWIVELKNTQSGLFFLLAILFFARWVERKPRLFADGEYLAAVGFAACAIASKSSTIVLPIELCLLAWWIERRCNFITLAATLPILVLSIASGLVSIWTQSVQFGTDVDGRWVRSWPERFAGAGDAIWFYLGKLICPWPLMPIYPRWTYDPSHAAIYLPLIAATALLGVLWYFRHTAARPFFVTWAWFLIALGPVLGFASLFYFRFSIVADHFQYLASMGPLVLVGSLFFIASQKLPGAKFVPGAVLLFLVGVLTCQRAVVYQNEQSLWTDGLAKNPSAWIGYNHLGAVVILQGKLDDAIADFQKSVELNPVFPDAHNDLAIALVQKGRLNEALVEFDKAVHLNPLLADAHYDYGVALTDARRFDEAVQQFVFALRLVPNAPGTRLNLGIALDRQGRLDDAIVQFRAVLAVAPNSAEAHNDLGIALAQKGQFSEAEAEFEETLHLRPDYPNAKINLDRTRQQQAAPKK